MKRIILLLCLSGFYLGSFSQKVDLLKFEKDRTGIQKKSMIALAGWSVANIVISGIATKESNYEMQNFHQMNVMWGSINLAIAGLGYWSARREKIDNPTIESVLKHQNRLKKTYLVNAGLDVLYMAGGLIMTNTSMNQKDPDKFKGYGNSIILQGGFLLVYDAINYAIHRKHGKQLGGMIEKIQLSGGLGSVSLVYHF